MTKNSLIDVGDISKPVTKLIEVVSSGMGTLYAPYGTVRQAKANAKAKIIIAEADSEVATIEGRAYKRLLHREGIRQENLENITSIAANELPKEVSETPVDFDWVTQYLNHAQDVRDEELQLIWARILAGEVTSPGSYSKRTLEFLKTLDKLEAEKFTEFCSFVLISANDGWGYTIECDKYNKLIKEKFENRDYVGHFSAIGLLRSDLVTTRPSNLNDKEFFYFGEKYIFKYQKEPQEQNKFQKIEPLIMTTHFSSIGKQLAEIANPSPIDNYIEDIAKSMNESFKVKIERVPS